MIRFLRKLIKKINSMNEFKKELGVALVLIAAPVIAAFIVGLRMGWFQGILGL